MAEEAAEGAEDGAKGGKKKLLFIIGGVLLLVVIGAGAAFALIGGDEPVEGEEVAEEAEQVEEEIKEAHYIPFTPAFVVNFQTSKTRSRYMKLEMNAVTYEPEAVEQVNKHMPAIRNSLVFLFQTKTFDELSSAEAKEQLRVDALAAIQGVMEQRTGNASIDDLYFTNLVMQ